jgi:hypothetical protein
MQGPGLAAGLCLPHAADGRARYPAACVLLSGGWGGFGEGWAIKPNPNFAPYGSEGDSGDQGRARADPDRRVVFIQPLNRLIERAGSGLRGCGT